MEERHRITIRQTYIFLKDSLHPEGYVLDSLFAASIIIQREKNNILYDAIGKRDSSDQAEELLKLLPTLGPNAFDAFLDALRGSRRGVHDTLVEALENCLKLVNTDLDEKEKARAIPKRQVQSDVNPVMWASTTGPTAAAAAYGGHHSSSSYIGDVPSAQHVHARYGNTPALTSIPSAAGTPADVGYQHLGQPTATHAQATHQQTIAGTQRTDCVVEHPTCRTGYTQEAAFPVQELEIRPRIESQASNLAPLAALRPGQPATAHPAAAIVPGPGVMSGSGNFAMVLMPMAIPQQNPGMDAGSGVGYYHQYPTVSRQALPAPVQYGQRSYNAYCACTECTGTRLSVQSSSGSASMTSGYHHSAGQWVQQVGMDGRWHGVPHDPAQPPIASGHRDVPRPTHDPTMAAAYTNAPSSTGRYPLSAGQHTAPHNTLHNAAHSTLHNAAHNTPHNAPHNTLHNAPHNTLHNAAHNTLHNAPHNTPHTAPHNTLYTAPHNTLHTAPHNTLHNAPHSEERSPTSSVDYHTASRDTQIATLTTADTGQRNVSLSAERRATDHRKVSHSADSTTVDVSHDNAKHTAMRPPPASLGTGQNVAPHGTGLTSPCKAPCGNGVPSASDMTMPEPHHPPAPAQPSDQSTSAAPYSLQTARLPPAVVDTQRQNSDPSSPLNRLRWNFIKGSIFWQNKNFSRNHLQLNMHRFGFCVRNFTVEKQLSGDFRTKSDRLKKMLKGSRTAELFACVEVNYDDPDRHRLKKSFLKALSSTVQGGEDLIEVFFDRSQRYLMIGDCELPEQDECDGGVDPLRLEAIDPSFAPTGQGVSGSSEALPIRQRVTGVIFVDDTLRCHPQFNILHLRACVHMQGFVLANFTLERLQQEGLRDREPAETVGGGNSQSYLLSAVVVLSGNDPEYAGVQEGLGSALTAVAGEGNVEVHPDHNIEWPPISTTAQTVSVSSSSTSVVTPAVSTATALSMACMYEEQTDGMRRSGGRTIHVSQQHMSAVTTRSPADSVPSHQQPQGGSHDTRPRTTPTPSAADRPARAGVSSGQSGMMLKVSDGTLPCIQDMKGLSQLEVTGKAAVEKPPSTTKGYDDTLNLAPVEATPRLSVSPVQLSLSTYASTPDKGQRPVSSPGGLQSIQIGGENDPLLQVSLSKEMSKSCSFVPEGQSLHYPWNASDLDGRKAVLHTHCTKKSIVREESGVSMLHTQQVVMTVQSDVAVHHRLQDGFTTRTQCTRNMASNSAVSASGGRSSQAGDDMEMCGPLGTSRASPAQGTRSMAGYSAASSASAAAATNRQAERTTASDSAVVTRCSAAAMHSRDNNAGRSTASDSTVASCSDRATALDSQSPPPSPFRQVKGCGAPPAHNQAEATSSTIHMSSYHGFDSTGHYGRQQSVQVEARAVSQAMCASSSPGTIAGRDGGMVVSSQVLARNGGREQVEASPPGYSPGTGGLFSKFKNLIRKVNTGTPVFSSAACQSSGAGDSRAVARSKSMTSKPEEVSGDGRNSETRRHRHYSSPQN